jgi:hypothetical protein
VLDLIAQQFTFPAHFGKNFDALYDCMTDPLHKSGRSRASSWCWSRYRPTASSTRKRASSCSTSSGMPPTTGATEDPVQVLLFFSVARSAQTSQAERANEAKGEAASGPAEGIELMTENGEKMPTSLLVDITPQALRMSSPFNAGYWLTAA